MLLFLIFIIYFFNFVFLIYIGERVDIVYILGVGWIDCWDIFINVRFILGFCVFWIKYLL